MNKILQRTKKESYRAAQRRSKRKALEENAEDYVRRQGAVSHGRRLKETRRRAGQANKEDYELGPLAPRRDVGELRSKYGAMTPDTAMLPRLSLKQTLKWWPIAMGDRAVITNGDLRGKIGMVESINELSNSVKFEKLGLVDITLPKWYTAEMDFSQEIMSVSREIRVEDIKLVYPLTDRETGRTADTIIEKLIPINREYDKIKKEMTRGERVVAGTRTVIPWPPEPVVEPEEPTGTEEDQVHLQTFTPWLQHAPMPLSVIDELRNKFSKFRTRHEPEYLEKVEAKEADFRNRQKLAKTMQTPLQELAEVRARKKRDMLKNSGGKQRSTIERERLAAIGEAIALERAKRTTTAEELNN